MKVPSLDAITTSFLRCFFGPGNPVAWAKILEIPPNHDLSTYLMPWFEGLSKNPSALVVLPRPIEHDSTLWYALGHSVSDAEMLRENLLAFLGPTHSDFDGRRAALDPDDGVDAAVMAFTDGHAFKFRVPSSHRSVARALLLRMHDLWQQRPWRKTHRVRLTSRILREFELALATGNGAEAALRIAELKEGGRLDARNLIFLEIRRLATVEQWQDIITLPQLPDLAQMRCPVPVAEAVLQAIYALEFVTFETRGDAHSAISHFRASVVGRWSSFFRVLSTMQAPSALKLFMMLAACADPPRPDLRNAILASPALRGSDRTFCEALASFVVTSPAVPLERIDQAAARVEAGDYDFAFPLLLTLPVSERTLSLMLHCAVELQRLDATRALHEVFLSAPERVRSAVLSSARHRVLWKHLAGSDVPPTLPPAPVTAPEEVPGDWIAWLERLTRRGRWPKAVEVAEHGAREWSPVALLSDPEKVTEVQRWIATRDLRDEAAQSTLRDAVPHLVAFLLREPALLHRAKDLLLDLLLLLTDDAEAGASDLAAVRDVVSALIDLGPRPGDYREYISFLEEMWARFEAPRSLDWLLDMIEVLLLCPCPAQDARTGFLSRALSGFAKWKPHVRTDQWRLLSVLCRDLEAGDLCAELVPPLSAGDHQPEVEATSLDGKTVAIYSLMEGPAKHARDALLQEFPGVDVVLNADKVATDRLRQLAERADIFVMVTWAAKHAATGCIEAARHSNLPLLRPVSKSATAILRELRSHLRGN